MNMNRIRTSKILRAFGLVRQVRFFYASWFGLVAVLYVVVAVFPQNWLNFKTILINSFSLETKIKVVRDILLSVPLQYPGIWFFVVIASVILFALNCTYMMFLYRSKRVTARANGAGLVGGFLAFLGVGCAACGPAVIGPVLSLFGASALLTILPFHGQEFLLLGLVACVYGVWSASKAIITT